MSLVDDLVNRLQIPAEFARYAEVDGETRARLDAWTSTAPQTLKQLLIVAAETATSKEKEQMSAIICAAAPFAINLARLNDSEYLEEANVLRDECPWVTPDAQATAHELLTLMGTQDAVSRYILSEKIKPAFRDSNPHPHVNPNTGKSLQSASSRPPQQGGFASVTVDFYQAEGQRWKDWVGLGAVLHYCISTLEANAYDAVWYLVIPPLMTFLDDFQPRYKLWGLFMARAMLNHVPADILRRTGVDGLLRESFMKALTTQEGTLAPPIYRVAVAQTLRLTLLTTKEGSKERFDALSSLVGQGIITDTWTYAFDKPEILRATLDALPDVVVALDIGCIRFLKMLIPQLIQPLVLPPPVDPLQLQLQKSSLRVLIHLLTVCAPRIFEWRLTILDALARCWVLMVVDSDCRGDLERLLQEVCAKLADACPSLREVEFPKILAADRRALEGLLEQSAVA